MIFDHQKRHPHLCDFLILFLLPMLLFARRVKPKGNTDTFTLHFVYFVMFFLSANGILHCISSDI